MTFFKNGRVIYHYLGLEKELNRMLLRCVVARVSFSIDLQSIKKNSSNFLILPIKLYDILSIQLNIHTRPASERGHERGCRNFLSLKESVCMRKKERRGQLFKSVRRLLCSDDKVTGMHRRSVVPGSQRLRPSIYTSAEGCISVPRTLTLPCDGDGPCVPLTLN